ncbi:MAG: pyrroline-5-carboxylate reductase [Nitrospirae bacterium]|nr:pyrroline-5-carboxylate reductase [Nitrospirota bacterium]
MSQASFSVLGVGNMGSILLKSLVSLPFTSPEKISVFDPDPLSMKKAGKYKVRVARHLKEAVEGKAFVVLAVKPQMMTALLNEIRDFLLPEAVVVSVAAGVSIEKIQTVLKRDQKVARAMPNTPAILKKGMTALVYSGRLSSEEKAFVRRIFNRVGKTIVVTEDKMDAVTALSGSGPAYVFTFVEALVEGGVKMGLSEPVAYQMATQTLFGAVKMLIKLDLTPAEQIKKVTSPGGTTLAGLAMLESGRFKEIVISAMEAAAKRSAELGSV